MIRKFFLYGGQILLFSLGAFLFGSSTALLRAQISNVSYQIPHISADSFIFSREIHLGQKSFDVFELQKVLNRDSFTQIASQGVGSPGRESLYYGTLTKNAVIRFKMKYLGQMNPDGSVVDSVMRDRLNEQYVQNVQKSQTTQVANTATSTRATLDQVRVYQVIPHQIQLGDSIEIKGQGFLTNTTLYIGSTTIPNINPTDSQTITLLPSQLPKIEGFYKVFVENSNGSSRGAIPEVSFIIAPNRAPFPQITSVTPHSVSLTDTITVIGQNFGTSTNAIVSAYGYIQNIPSDGQKITFSLSQLSSLNLDQIRKVAQGFPYLPISLSLSNGFDLATTTITVDLKL